MHAQPGSFVDRQHAQVSTPRSVLAGLVRRAVGVGIEQAARIVEGYDNEVYRILCADGQDVVVRILRFGRFAGDSARSAAEVWAIDAARAVGVPAPELLLLDTVRLDGSEFPVMVQRALVHDLAVLRVRGPQLDLPPLLAGSGLLAGLGAPGF